MLPACVSSRATVTSKACMLMEPHRESPFGYFRLRCKPSAKQTSLLCIRFALKFHETEDNTNHSAPIITVTKNRFAKHYFIGDKRIASKLGVGKFSNVYGISGNNVTAFHVKSQVKSL